MTLVLDTGALIGAERGDRDVVSRLRMAFSNGDESMCRRAWSAKPGGILHARPSYPAF